MYKTKTLVLVFASIFLATLWGCGSNLDSGGDQTGPDTTLADAQPVGISNCLTCHLSGVGNIWLAGVHGNPNLEPGPEVLTNSSCVPCHDQLGDGQNLLTATSGAVSNRPVVGCESCHGGGQFHRGVGPLPAPRPVALDCGQCHASLPGSHLVYRPEANNIISDYLSSAHALPEAAPEELQEELRNEAKCVKCHNDEGGRTYRDVVTVEGLALTTPIAGDVSPIQCRTCHNAHTPGELLKEATASASAEYNTCTNCHQRHDATVTTDPSPGTTSDGAGAVSGSLTDGTLIYHAKRWDRVIASTHNDDPSTASIIEGYAMDPANERACRDCHNVHAADVEINEQWAQSGHGGELLTAKEEAAASQPNKTWAQILAVRAAGSTSTWAADPWPTDDEAECQRCHTATGGKNFMNDSVAYIQALRAYLASGENGGTLDPSLLPNDFSYLQPGQQEMLYCWGCHSNNAGGMRGVGKSISLPDRGYYIMAVVPNVGKSSVCVGCHGGRANRGYIAGLPNADRSNRALTHYLAASGTLFSERTHTGYEYDIDNDFDPAEHYKNPSYFKHNVIGLSGDTPETGTGPCASCHMNEAGHSFSAVTVDAVTSELTITNQALCNTCHTTYPVNAAILEEESAGFQNALLLLLDYVNGSSAGSVTNYKDLDLTSSTNLRLITTSAKDYGAQQNYAYLKAEPGAYVHNRYYAKRLIFDSIDWLDNKTMDNTITIDVVNYPEAVNWFNADATTGIATRP